MTEEQRLRYSRHLALPEIGVIGQEKLINARVLVIGAGGLGSPVIQYLAGAGVGTLGIADGDCVDVSNLQRQVLHSTPDIGRPKVDSARERVELINPDVKVETYCEFLTSDNIIDVITQYDFVVDATDSFDAKYLINDSCVKAGVPYSHGGISRYEGQTMTILPDSPCLRCLFAGDMPRPEIVKAGPFGAIAGMLGTIQAAEAIKYITGIGQLLSGRLLRFDALTMQFSMMNIIRNPSCRLHMTQ